MPHPLKPLGWYMPAFMDEQQGCLQRTVQFLNFHNAPDFDLILILDYGKFSIIWQLPLELYEIRWTH